MVQRLTPTFSGGNSDVQVFLDLALPDEVIETPRPQAGVEWYILSAGFTRYDAGYFNLASSGFPVILFFPVPG